MRTLMTALVLLFATQAQAESWGGKDKWQHAIVGAATGAAFTKATDDWRYGCAAAAAVGLAKELYDRQHRDRHTPSFKDFAVTAAAGCGSSIVVAPNYIGLNIKF
jgi:hypothetical protein